MIDGEMEGVYKSNKKTEKSKVVQFWTSTILSIVAIAISISALLLQWRQSQEIQRIKILPDTVRIVEPLNYKEVPIPKKDSSSK